LDSEDEWGLHGNSGNQSADNNVDIKSNIHSEMLDPDKRLLNC
jgi:hypothetical protein